MDEDRLEGLLRSVDGPVSPRSDFADRLYSQLATDLRLGAPVERPRGRVLRRRRPVDAPAARPRGGSRWMLVLVGAVLLTLGGFAALSTQRSGLTCDDDAIQEVRSALAAVPAYSYSAVGDYSESGTTFGVDVEGEFQSPNRVRELHSDPDAARSKPPLYGGEWLRIGERQWWRRAIGDPDLPPWEPVEGDAFRRYSFSGLAYVYASLPENPALFALAGLADPSPPLTWSASPSGETADPGICVLTGVHVPGSSGAELRVSAWVDEATALPERISWELAGYRLGEASRDRSLEYRFRYGQVEGIIPPPEDEVRPEFSLPPGVSLPPDPRLTLSGTGTVTLADAQGEYLRLRVVDIMESPILSSSAALPGHTFLSVRLRYEPLRRLAAGHAEGERDWQFFADDFSIGVYGNPAYIPGGPEPRLPTILAMGTDGIEGWMSVEVPLDGDVVMRFKARTLGEDSELHVILREDR